MKVQRLIEKYKKLEGVWNAEGAELARQIFLQDLQQLDEPEKVKVSEEEEKFLKTFDFNCENDVTKALYNVSRAGWGYYLTDNNGIELKDLTEGFRNLENRKRLIKAILDGYEVEKEKKYEIKLLNRNDGDLYLFNQNANLGDKYGHFSPVVLLFTKSTFFSEKCYKLTKKDVVANGFGWVFDCPGIKIEEVEE